MPVIILTVVSRRRIKSCQTIEELESNSKT